MKKLFTLLLVVISLKATSQELETILLAREDAEKITNAYLDPGFKGLIYSMNNGWYHTAKVHKKLGFDITFGASFSSVPSEEEIFRLSALGLSSNTSYNQDETPTLAGDGVTPATVTYTTTVQGQTVSADFELPEGIQGDLPLSAVPAPNIQVSVGLPYKLDAILRVTPKVGSDDVKGSIFGVGLKKEITDWFGVVDKTPLHVSLLAAYSTMNVDYNIGDVSGDVSTQDASADFKLNTFTVQAIASINLPVINFYGGVGYNTGNVKLNMLGDYTLTYDTSVPNVTVSETVTDPLSLKSNAGSPNATVGARLSLGFFKIFGAYTLQEYNSFNAGIAFSFR